MRFGVSVLLLALAALLAYMAYYAILNIADGDLAYVAVLVVELAAAAGLAADGFRALRRE